MFYSITALNYGLILPAIKLPATKLFLLFVVYPSSFKL